MYYLVILLQIYCFYHVYSNRNSYYWIFLILFLPGIGSAIYLLTQVFGKTDVGAAQEQAFNVLYPSKRINDLEKKLAFSDTFENRVALADAYFQNKRYEEARDMYLSALKGNYENDYYGISNLIRVYFELENYDKVITYSERFLLKMEFKQSDLQFLYAIALEKTGQTEKAEEALRKVDIPYKNYKERLYLAEFLLAKNYKDEAKELLEDLLSEANHMQRKNYRKYMLIFQKVKALHSQL
ncbi:hypothetical protein [Neptunitalea lumnitzerae]|uniref:Tetratricopeptide repeat protein n=1 Tax=Neptunitalea lumnitzerae TaxID=2965509 RepID=A0ABQ5MNB6_9FLAO|nr:hypothetical protein [Neptunitalea sp. Y10]GLB50896.1 hypothetical protein Y10_32640 [Neptunitalea sp. Y10]